MINSHKASADQILPSFKTVIKNLGMASSFTPSLPDIHPPKLTTVSLIIPKMASPSVRTTYSQGNTILNTSSYSPSIPSIPSIPVNSSSSRKIILIPDDKPLNQIKEKIPDSIKKSRESKIKSTLGVQQSAANNKRGGKNKCGRKKISTIGFWCRECEVTKTPEWRKGPLGQNTLCNACGLRYAKRQNDEERLTGQKKIYFISESGTK